MARDRILQEFANPTSSPLTWYQNRHNFSSKLTHPLVTKPYINYIVQHMGSPEELRSREGHLKNDDSSFFVGTDQRGDVTLLTVRGEIDMLTAPEVATRCSKLADEGQSNVIVDARGITFIDATGMRAFIDGRSAIHEGGGNFSVIPSRQVRRLLDILELHELFPTYSTPEDAVSELG